MSDDDDVQRLNEALVELKRVVWVEVVKVLDPLVRWLSSVIEAFPLRRRSTR